MLKNNQPFDAEKKLEELRQRKAKHENKILPDNIKFCPFVTTPNEEYPCNPKCAIYRNGRGQNFACPIAELPNISWHLAGRPGRGTAQNNGRYQQKY